MRPLFRGLRALAYMTAFMLFWGWLALGARKFDPLIGISLPDWFQLLGVVFMIAGGGLALTCVGLFVWRGRGTPAPFDPPMQFVAAGPYRYVRNPMYLGGLTLLVGFGLWLGSVSIVVFALLLLLPAHLFVLLFEEPDLERRFGSGYTNL